MYIMSAYYPPRENVPIFDAGLFIEENSPTGVGGVFTGSNNLDYIRTTIAQQTLPAYVPVPPDYYTGNIFPESITLPTIGTYKIVGNFKVIYLGGAQPTTNSAGFFINIGSPAFVNPLSGAITQYQEWTELTGSFPNGLGIYKQFSVPVVYTTTTANKVITIAYGAFGSPDGIEFSGSIYAYKISSSTA